MNRNALKCSDSLEYGEEARNTAGQLLGNHQVIFYQQTTRQTVTVFRCSDVTRGLSRRTVEGFFNNFLKPRWTANKRAGPTSTIVITAAELRAGVCTEGGEGRAATVGLAQPQRGGGGDGGV